MSDLNSAFRELSNSGLNVMFLKSNGICDCYNPKSLVNSEPDPYCEKCLGTGRKRIFVKSEKLRYQKMSSQAGIQTNDELFKGVEDKIILFAYEYYKIFDSEDLVFINGAEENILYEITDKKPFVYNNFSFLELYCEKVKFSSNVLKKLKGARL